jgi:hypothetical protein
MFAYCLLIAACLLAVAEAGSWSKTDYRASIMFGIGFNNETNGMIAAGTYVAVTSDAGSTWQSVTAPTTDLITLAMAANGESSGALSGLGVGTFPNSYSTDAGNTWQQTTGYTKKTLSACTSVTPWGKNGFIWTGAWGTHNGMIASSDGGATADGEYDWGVDGTQQPYETAAPSDDVWYSAGGIFPTTPPSMKLAPGVKAIAKSPYVTILVDAGVLWHTHAEVRTAQVGNDTGYAASITKTTDGGKTFTTVFSDSTTGFYFLGIACTDENTCSAVAEGKDIGSFIQQTTDGGVTWTTTWTGPLGTALAGITMLDANNGWACGLSSAGASLLLVTADGGNTWTDSGAAFKGTFPQSIAFNSDSTAFATAITQAQIAVLLQYA